MFVKTILTSVWVTYCIFSWYDHLTMSETAFDFILLERGFKLYPQGQTRSPLFPLSRGNLLLYPARKRLLYPQGQTRSPLFPVSRGNLLLHPGSCSSCDASEPLVRISHLWLWPPSPAFGTLRTCHKQRTILSHCHIVTLIVTYCRILLYIVIHCHIVAYCHTLSQL